MLTDFSFRLFFTLHLVRKKSSSFLSMVIEVGGVSLNNSSRAVLPLSTIVLALFKKVTQDIICQSLIDTAFKEEVYFKT